ncbi:MAG TPA: HNH endonuclease signature motif containing protein, partial [Brevibacterium sp.]|nr:HNH endonuclease signature motif containing protein [Brevibacterium sp.]
SADDLVRPGALLSTHAGAPTTLGDLEGWSNAAQMFVHVTDGGGRSLDVRSQGRFATRTQMAVLAARDQGCTFPDCDAPAEWCEAHHILAYAQGGKTEIDNLTLVCPFHHRWFERSGWDSVFRRGLPGWLPPQSVDPRRRTLFHSRFRVALLGLPPELPLSGA